jgi:hypothetical protein
MGKRRAGSQIGNLTPDHQKSRIDPNPKFSGKVRHGVGKLSKSYKIASDLIPIEGLSKKLRMPKVPGVQTGTVSGLLLGSPGKKCHSDVASAESCREYYKGGGGFPRVRAVVSQVSPRLPVACPNTKRVQNEF